MPLNVSVSGSDEIWDRIFLGSMEAASDLEALKAAGAISCSIVFISSVTQRMREYWVLRARICAALI